MIVHPVSLGIAQLAGRVEGEQAAMGISIAIEDLVIGATALYVGFDVATLNVKHFHAIPGSKSSRSEPPSVPISPPREKERGQADTASFLSAMFHLAN
jgi:hypothetical protein